MRNVSFLGFGAFFILGGVTAQRRARVPSRAWCAATIQWPRCAGGQQARRGCVCPGLWRAKHDLLHTHSESAAARKDLILSSRYRAREAPTN